MTLEKIIRLVSLLRNKGDEVVINVGRVELESSSSNELNNSSNNEFERFIRRSLVIIVLRLKLLFVVEFCLHVVNDEDNPFELPFNLLLILFVTVEALLDVVAGRLKSEFEVLLLLVLLLTDEEELDILRSGGFGAVPRKELLVNFDSQVGANSPPPKA